MIAKARKFTLYKDGNALAQVTVFPTSEFRFYNHARQVRYMVDVIDCNDCKQSYSMSFWSNCRNTWNKLVPDLWRAFSDHASGRTFGSFSADCSTAIWNMYYDILFIKRFAGADHE